MRPGSKPVDTGKKDGLDTALVADTKVQSRGLVHVFVNTAI